MSALTPNTAQIDYWNGDVGRRWALLQDSLDGLFAEITSIALTAAGLQPGERVIDIGCGCGATLLDLARGVGPDGSVSGFDISQVMLDVARRRIAASGLTQAGVAQADAATHAFEIGSADLVFSRFGVMFFDAPAEAFANIRTALKPGGRIAFVCWRAAEENGWVTVPMAAVAPFLDPEAPPSDPDAPGPFAFARAERLRRILGAAGFSSIDIVPRDARLSLGHQGDLKGAAALITQIGPVSRALKAVNDERRAAAESAVAAALSVYDHTDGIGLPAAVWLVTGRA